MRGQLERSASLFSYVSIEERIPAGHPAAADPQPDQALNRLNPTFCELYAAEDRPSVTPEQLLLASLLRAFYGIRSIRSAQQAAKAAAGSAAAVIGRPITRWLEPARMASAGVITRC